MNRYYIAQITLSVQATDHAEVLAVVSNAIREKNDALSKEGKRARIDLTTVDKVKEDK